jgi:hypothetical protein
MPPTETTRPGIRQPPAPLTITPEPVRIVNFESGLYEAKQEAQWGNLAIFRSNQDFLKFSGG